jgi:hypothetical protein
MLLSLCVSHPANIGPGGQIVTVLVPHALPKAVLHVS